jgi:hypothetical protein
MLFNERRMQDFMGGNPHRRHWPATTVSPGRRGTHLPGGGSRLKGSRSHALPRKVVPMAVSLAEKFRGQAKAVRIEADATRACAHVMVHSLPDARGLSR